MTDLLTSEAAIVTAAVALGATEVAGLSPAEIALTAVSNTSLPRSIIRALRALIRDGGDPLGDAFARLRTSEVRREQGATYTPDAIVQAMIAWAARERAPDRVVDPGVGSARFLVAAGRRFRRTKLIGIEIDPLAALMARAHLAAAGMAARSRIELGDYRLPAPRFAGRTLWIGNPPYVRHHQIGSEWKQWLTEVSSRYGYKASQLAGLHVYFFLATVLRAAPGDRGAFITAAEWMDVNYGQLVRELFLGELGGQGIVLVEPTAAPFPDAQTTAAITTFELGSQPTSVRVRRVQRVRDLDGLAGGRLIRRERLEAESRWTRLTHVGRDCPAGYVELGELCRVHRGTVTGANHVFIAGDAARDVPARFLVPSVTKARELISAGRVLDNAAPLRSVVDLPADLDELDADDRAAVDLWLRSAKASGAHEGYIARHRRSWWSVGLRSPAPILATYMARRPPSFVRNAIDARHINVAHGLYPRDTLTEGQMTALIEHLSTRVSVQDGRTYAGGLTKFEPGEMERLYVPSPILLGEMHA